MSRQLLFLDIDGLIHILLVALAVLADAGLGFRVAQILDALLAL